MTTPVSTAARPQATRPVAGRPVAQAAPSAAPNGAARPAATPAAPSALRASQMGLPAAQAPAQKALEGRVAQVYHQTVAQMNRDGQRLSGGPAVAWAGNILANSGADGLLGRDQKLCVEQAEILAEALERELGAQGVQVFMQPLAGGTHTVAKIQVGGRTLYADPWAGTAPTADVRQIYGAVRQVTRGSGELTLGAPWAFHSTRDERLHQQKYGGQRAK